MNVLSAIRTFRSHVLADYESHQQQREKYWENYSRESVFSLLLKDISVQSMAAVRLMQLASNLNLPLGATVLSRCIRILYKMEIHPNAQIEPGITLIHGTGLVIAANAKVGSNCIIAHNVTLGQKWDADRQNMVGPTLENNVHIGPGVNIIGPVIIGANSKVMAGAEVTQSVPPHTLVMPPKSTVEKRSEPHDNEH